MDEMLKALFVNPDRVFIETRDDGTVIIGYDDGQVEYAFQLLDHRNID